MKIKTTRKTIKIGDVIRPQTKVLEMQTGWKAVEFCTWIVQAKQEKDILVHFGRKKVAIWFSIFETEWLQKPRSVQS